MLRRIVIGVVILTVVLFIGHHPDKASADAKHGGNWVMQIADGWGNFFDNLLK